ncbi:MAG: crossover junction endodeoxyribonuclease RuvC [Clostridia bacterium]|nr:crossover junction endodeoxyribonuclease RuvC [Clostridia bacterium]
MSVHSLRVMGIDPGLAHTGYAVLELRDRKPVLVEGGIIHTAARDSMAHRLQEIYRGLMEAMEEFRPHRVAIEAAFANSLTPKAALLVGQVRAICLLAAAQKCVQPDTYSPTEVKKALTGRGRASKAQVQGMVRAALNWPEVIKPDHVADACALALCYLQRQRDLEIGL